MSVFLRTDVTAVKLHDKYIFAGIGSHLNVFSYLDFNLLARKQVFKGQKIYGIIPFGDENIFLLFGGKQFTIVQLEQSDDDHITLNQLFDCILCDDWIQAGIWLGIKEIALLTAHNVVQKWDTNNKCLTSQHASKGNSILYSGLLVALDEDVLVFAGTVYSKVIIHSSLNDEELHSLTGHKGVIFSIACDPVKEMIVTTSDDRSVHVWSPMHSVDLPKTTLDYWKRINIVCKFKVYGHLARVMKSIISEEFIISVGEDAAICFWDLEGKLVTKFKAHQNGCIWAVDSNQTHLITGGGDNGLILHPLTLVNKYKESNIMKTNNKVKSLVFTAKANVVLLCDNDDVVYYNVKTNTESVICKLKQDSSYKLLSISPCKQLISTVDMCGNLDIFAENCKYEFINRIFSMKLEVDSILSMHWTGNRFLVLCCEKGIIVVVGANSSETQLHAKFVLPNCKERFLTAAAYDEKSNSFVFSDRCGNIHFYNKDEIEPFKTLRKVHGRYGATSITFKNNKIITTGRDGTIKYFSYGKTIKQTHSLDLNFQWVERFIDRDQNVVCGFQERIFVIYDVRNFSTILEAPCGGGHRAWDITRYFSKIDGSIEEFIKLIYVKKSLIYEETFRLSTIVSKNVIVGGHIKEINCLKVCHPVFNKSIKIIISGSEDTALRISTLNIKEANNNKNELIFKHLSSIKCIKTFKLEENKILLISAGGRAQICIKLLCLIEGSNNEIDIKSEDLVNYMIKGNDKERKGVQTWRNCTIDFDPETRIMDVDIVNGHDNNYYVVAGCSDSFLRIFKLCLNENNCTIDLIDSVKYHETCILKTHVFKHKDNSLLATTSTIGEVVIWDFLEKQDKVIKAIFHTKTNKSGINDLAIEVVDNNILIATCGDDNEIHLVNLIKDEDIINIVNKWSTNKYHCSLISGILLLDCKYIISASIDQRVTLSKWKIVNNELENEFIAQVISDVPDIHGIEVIDKNIDYALVCVYGKGMEIIRMPFTATKSPL